MSGFDQKIEVELQEWMGSDRKIAESAWTSSYDKSKSLKKSDEEVEKVVRFLAKHKHGTPFEAVVFRFWLRIPIYVDRQHMTHRVACLSQNNYLYFDLPSGSKYSKFRLNKMKISDFVKKWENGIKSKTRWGNTCVKSHRKRLKQMKLRSLNENTGEIEHTNIVNVYNKGIQPIFKFTFENGYEIKTTLNHKFHTNKGWMTIGKALNLKENLKETPNIFCTDYMFSANGLFQKGRIPWNKGKTYKHSKSYNISEKERERKRQAASGANSNFWKGGITSRSIILSRECSRKLSKKVFKRDKYTCQQCGDTRNQLNAHHIIPLYEDLNQAMNMNNLVTLCISCHKHIHNTNKEEEFAKNLLNKDIIFHKKKYTNKTSVSLKRKYIRIKSVKYIGLEKTYDFEVNGPFHNFICNGLVVHNSHNGLSGRYRTVPFEYYDIPDDVTNILDKTHTGMDKRWEKVMGHNEYPTDYKDLHFMYINSCETAVNNYRNGITFLKQAEKDGVITNKEYKRVREVWRGQMPQATMTERTTIFNLRSFANYQKLRNSNHAQPEIKLVAEKMLEVVKKENVCPIAVDILEKEGWNI